MTSRDSSQVPVEQLARLLLDRAREDPELPCRSPANSNAAPPGWVAPAAQVFQRRVPADTPGGSAREPLEAMVARAFAAAQQAEHAAQRLSEARRRANRGAAIAMAFGILGMLTGIAAVTGYLPNPAGRAPVPEQPAAVAAAGSGQEHGDASVTQAAPAGRLSPRAAAPTLAPATYVRVLPAVASVAQYPPPGYQPSSPSGWELSSRHYVGGGK